MSAGSLFDATIKDWSAYVPGAKNVWNGVMNNAKGLAMRIRSILIPGQSVSRISLSLTIKERTSPMECRQLRSLRAKWEAIRRYRTSNLFHFQGFRHERNSLYTTGFGIYRSTLTSIIREHILLPYCREITNIGHEMATRKLTSRVTSIRGQRSIQPTQRRYVMP